MPLPLTIRRGLSWRGCEEQAMEGGVAEAFHIRRAIGPGAGEEAEKIFVRIADPQTGFGREPIQLAQPLSGGFEARVVENFRFVVRAFSSLVGQPVVAVPKPDAAVALAFGEQPQADGVIEQFENKLRLGGMGDAQFLPIQPVAGLRAAQMREQAMAEFADGNGGAILPQFEHGRGRRVAQEIKFVAGERERRLAGKEKHVRQRVNGAVGQFEPVRERQIAAFAVFQVGRQFGDLPVELERFLVFGGFEPRAVAPMREPMHQFRVGQNQRVIAVLAVGMGVGEPLDEFPIVRRKEFLLVRGAGGQFDHVLQRAKFFAGARAQEVKLDAPGGSARRFRRRVAAGKGRARSRAENPGARASAGKANARVRG